MKRITVFSLIVLGYFASSCKKDHPTAKIQSRLFDVASAITAAACGLPVTITKNIKTDFGASGNGFTDDSRAFLDAAHWINNNWDSSGTICLYIPAGDYRVGLQLPPGGSFQYNGGTIINPPGGATLQGIDMLRLVNVKNVVIYGDAGMSSRVIYHSNLRFGGMTGGGACDYGAGCTSAGCSAMTYASVGTFLKLTGCACITVKDLWINGNVRHCSLQGHYGECNGYEIGYDGLLIEDGSEIEVRDCELKSFGRDGIMTRYLSSNPLNISFINVNCDSNCRQGFSFTAGDNLTVTNCKFSNSGSIFYNNPGCGLDIEPENGGTCLNSSFSGCAFINNSFVGMISDNHGSSVSNISFSNCEFSATEATSLWSLWPKRMSGTSFWHCTIRGSFCHVSGISNADKIEFHHCNITDWDGGPTPYVGWNRYLMDLGASPPDNNYYLFDHNVFEVHHSYLAAMAPNSSGGASAERQFTNNTFNFHYSDLRKAFPGHVPVPTPFLGHFKSCYLDDNYFFDADQPTVNPNCAWNTCYWIGIYTNYGSSGDNFSTGTNYFPQNGTGGWSFTRVCYNPNWIPGHYFITGVF
jgi:hypothetical protein